MKENTELWIEIDGERFAFSPDDNNDIIPVQGNEFHMLADGKGFRIEVIDFDLEAKKGLFRINGENKVVRILSPLDLRIEHMGYSSVSKATLSKLIAPMPGLVKSILVKEGDTIEKDQPLIVLEAMKMENVLTAPQPTSIKSIDVKTGQAVEKGGLLIQFNLD